MSFFSSTDNKVIDLILDVGNDGITASLVEFSQGKRPHILFHYKDTVSFKKYHSDERQVSMILKTLDDVLKIVLVDGLQKSKKVRRVCCYLASPWYIAETHIVRFEKSQPMTMTKGMVNEMIEKEQKAFLQSLAQNPISSPVAPDTSSPSANSSKIINTPVLIESKILKSYVNGYPINEPIGKEAELFEFISYFSVTDADIIKHITESLHRQLHFKSLEFHSFLIGALTCIRDTMHVNEHFVLIEIAAESTTISMVKHGYIVETVSFPIGRNFYVQNVAGALNTLPQVALSFLRLYAENKSEQSIGAKIDEEVRRAGVSWQEGFSKALSSISEEFFVPRKAYLVCDSELVPIFKKHIEQSAFNQISSDEAAFAVMPLDKPSLQNYYTEATATVTPFTAIESLYSQAERHGNNYGV